MALNERKNNFPMEEKKKKLTRGFHVTHQKKRVYKYLKGKDRHRTFNCR